MLKTSIYIGEDIYINKDLIIAVLDAKTIRKSKDGKTFIEQNKKKGFSHIAKDEVKSYIITSEEDIKVYESIISSVSINKKFKKKGLKKLDDQ